LKPGPFYEEGQQSFVHFHPSNFKVPKTGALKSTRVPQTMKINLNLGKVFKIRGCFPFDLKFNNIGHIKSSMILSTSLTLGISSSST